MKIRAHASQAGPAVLRAQRITQALLARTTSRAQKARVARSGTPLAVTMTAGSAACSPSCASRWNTMSFSTTNRYLFGPIQAVHQTHYGGTAWLLAACWYKPAHTERYSGSRAAEWRPGPQGWPSLQALRCAGSQPTQVPTLREQAGCRQHVPLTYEREVQPGREGRLLELQLPDDRALGGARDVQQRAGHAQQGDHVLRAGAVRLERSGSDGWLVASVHESPKQLRHKTL